MVPCSRHHPLQAGELAAQEAALERACKFWTQGSLLGAFNQWMAVVEVRSVVARQIIGHCMDVNLLYAKVIGCWLPDASV